MVFGQYHSLQSGNGMFCSPIPERSAVLAWKRLKGQSYNEIHRVHMTWSTVPLRVMTAVTLWLSKLFTAGVLLYFVLPHILHMQERKLDYLTFECICICSFFWWSLACGTVWKKDTVKCFRDLALSILFPLAVNYVLSCFCFFFFWVLVEGYLPVVFSSTFMC